MLNQLKANTRLRRVAREAALLALLVIGILAARSTLADHYYVPSGSMEFTLFAGDRVVVDKRAYGYRIPFTTIDLFSSRSVRPGDVVIFDSPRDGVRLIKRIVAVGGDHVRISNGRLAINGEWRATPDSEGTEIIGGKLIRLNLRHGGGPPLELRVPEGQVLAIGDHRGRSADSRIFGPVAEGDIYGRAIAVYYRSGSGFGWISL